MATGEEGLVLHHRRLGLRGGFGIQLHRGELAGRQLQVRLRRPVPDLGRGLVRGEKGVVLPGRRLGVPGLPGAGAEVRAARPGARRRPTLREAPPRARWRVLLGARARRRPRLRLPRRPRQRPGQQGQLHGRGDEKPPGGRAPARGAAPVEPPAVAAPGGPRAPGVRPPRGGRAAGLGVVDQGRIGQARVSNSSGGMARGLVATPA